MIIRALVLSAVLAATGFASAPTAFAQWYSNGPVMVSASGGAFTITINSASPVGISCTGTSTLSGTLGGATGPAAGAWNLSSATYGGTSFGFSLSSCTTAGLLSNVSCSAQLWAETYDSWTGVMAGELRNLGCTVTLPSFPTCTFTLASTGPGGRALDLTYADTGVFAFLTSPAPTMSASWTAGCVMMTPRPGSATATTSAWTGTVTTPKPLVTFDGPWRSNGPQPTTASGSSPAFSIATAMPVGIGCSGAGLTTTIGGAYGPTVGPWDLSSATYSGASVGLTFSGCTVMGLAANMTCTPTVHLWAQRYSVPLDDIAGYLTGLSCTVKPTSFPSCTITVASTGPGGRAVNVTYDNTGTLRLLGTGQTMTASWSSCPFISPSAGSAAFQASAFDYTVTSWPVPVVQF